MNTFGDYAAYVASLSLEERRKLQEEREYAIHAAKKGCGKCGAPIGREGQAPGGAPFSTGPYKGRYVCMDCWTLHWDQHPEELADEMSREYVAQEAANIRLLKQKCEVLFEEGQTRVFLTERGTLVFSLGLSPGCAPNEFDPDRFQVLVRAMRKVDAAGMTGFCLSSLEAAGETA